MPTLNKLEYLDETKGQIKTALNQFGSGITDNDTFRSYVSKINNIYTNWSKVTGSGTDLELTQTKKGKMAITPQGGSSQESTTGKNLLNSITDTTTRNGITFTKNSDGTYTLNGTSTSDIDFNIASDVPLDLNTSYILSGSPSTASNTTYRIMGACTRENDSTTYIADNDGSGITIPSSKMIRVYINVKNGKTLNNVIFKPMIRLASITDDTYEPYTGGIPAPSPSYPFPVKTVTGENILVISNSDNSESQTYPISLGSIELNSSPDGTVKDEIFGTPDNWYKREYIGKVVLDGVNNAFTAKSNTNSNQLYISNEIGNMIVPNNNNVLGKGLSSHFKIKTAQNIYANDLIGFGIRTDNKNSFGFGASSDLTTLALANQWLQTQYNNGTPVTNYYLHVNYVDIPITDTTLINQLNDIYNNAHSYNGVTNITSAYADGNEQMVIEASALMKGGN